MTDFRRHRNSVDGREFRCRSCYRLRRQTPAGGDKGYNDRLKLEVIEHYSGGSNRCACCGEDEIAFLAIDHVDGRGAEHRRVLGDYRGGKQFNLWLRREGFPAGFQVLCHNCNIAKHQLGQCPHVPVHVISESLLF